MFRNLSLAIVFTIFSVVTLFLRCSSDAPGFNVLFPEFTLTRNVMLIGDKIQMVNNSKVNITSYKWTFEDGTPAESTEINPTVSFNTVGVKKIVLTVVGNGITDSITKEITVNNNVQYDTSPSFFDITVSASKEFYVSYLGEQKELAFSFYESLDENGVIIPSNLKQYVSANGVVPVYNLSDLNSKDRIYQQRNKYIYAPLAIESGGLYKGVVKVNNDLSSKYDMASDTVFVLQRTSKDRKMCGREDGEELDLNIGQNQGYYLNNNVFDVSGLNSGDTEKIVFCAFVLKNQVNDKVKQVVWRWDIVSNQRDVIGFPNILHGIGSDNTAPNKTRVTTLGFTTDSNLSYPKFVSFKDTPTDNSIRSFKIKYNFETHNQKNDLTRLFIDIYLNSTNGVTREIEGNTLLAMDNKTIIRYVIVNKPELNSGTERGRGVSIDNISYDVYAEKTQSTIEDGLVPGDLNQSKVKRIIALHFNDLKRSIEIERIDQELDVLSLIKALAANEQFGNDMFLDLKSSNVQGNKFDFYIQSVRMGIQLISGSGIVVINKFEVESQ